MASQRSLKFTLPLPNQSGAAAKPYNFARKFPSTDLGQENDNPS